MTDRVPRGWTKEDAMKTMWEEDPTELLGLEEEGGSMELSGSEDEEEEEPTEMMSLGGEDEGEEDEESFDMSGFEEEEDPTEMSMGEDDDEEEEDEPETSADPGASAPLSYCGRGGKLVCSR